MSKETVEVKTRVTHKDKMTGEVHHPGKVYWTTPHKAKNRRHLGLVHIQGNLKASSGPVEDKSEPGPVENKRAQPDLENKSRSELVSLAEEAGILDGIEGTGANGYQKVSDLRRGIRKALS